MSRCSGMVTTMLVPFTASARECAMQMLSNAMYVQQELPNVQMPDALRVRTREVCGTLVGAKHDLFTELFEIDALVAGDANDEVIAGRVERMVEWTLADLKALDEVVVALHDEGQRDPVVMTASLLVMESATNVVNAYQAMRRAAEGVLRAVHGAALPGGMPT